MEPSLAEIEDYKGDSNIAGGTAGAGADLNSPAPVQFDEGLKFLNEASMARGQYNKYLSDAYSQNLKDSITNLRSIDFSKAMTSDLPALREKYAALAKNVSDNFDVVRNPGTNPDVAGQLAQQEADLRGDIAQSTNHNMVNAYNKKFIADNPTFNTAENQGKIANFENTPMDQRKDYLLNTPVNFDLQKVAQAAAPYAIKTIQQEALSHDKNWINSTEGQQFSQDAYHKAALGILDNTIVNGQPLRDTYMKDYNLLPDEQKQALDPNSAFLAGIDALAPQTSLKTSFKANPFALNAQKANEDMAQEMQREKFQGEQDALNREMQIRFQKKGTIDPNEAGEAALKTLAISQSTGNIPSHTGQTLLADNSLITKTAVIPDPEDDKKKTTTSVKMPKQTYLYSRRDNEGTYRVFLRDNETGKLIEKQTSNDELLNNLSNQYGPNFAPQIGAAISTFSQQKFNKPIPDEQDLLNFYKLPPAKLSQATGLSTGTVIPPNNGSAAPKVATVNNDDDYKALAVGAQYMAPDGKIYIKK